MTIESGSAFVPNCILRDPRLSAQARLLYSILKSYAWQDDHAIPGQKRLANEMGCSDRMVRTYLQELEDCGLIRIEQRGKMTTNKYYLTDRINSEWKPISFSDRKPASTHIESDRKHTSAMTGNTLPVMTGSTLPTNKTQYTKTQINKTQPPPTPLKVVEGEKAELLKLIRTLIAGPSNQIISGATNQLLHKIVDNNPHEWVRQGFDISAAAGRDLRYLIGILDHWQRHEHMCKCGNPNGEKPTSIQQTQPGQPRQKTQTELDREADLKRWQLERRQQMPWLYDNQPQPQTVLA